MFVGSKPPLGKVLTQTLLPLVLVSTSLSSAAAQIFYKPGPPVESAEMGASLERYGEYTLIGADQDGTFDPETRRPAGLSARNGAVYVISDNDGTVVRTFQYLHDPDRVKEIIGTLPDENPLPMYLGSNVGISSQWLVSTLMWYGDKEQSQVPALFIVDRKDNESFGPLCPKADGLTDCSGVDDGIEIVPMPDSSFVISRANGLAVSDMHIAYVGTSRVLGYDKASLIVLSYNRSSGEWKQSSSFPPIPVSAGAEFSIDMSNYRLVVGVSANSNDPMSGRIYTSTYDIYSNSWSALDETTSNDAYFANSVAISRADEIVVGSGVSNSQGKLHFYQLTETGEVVYEDFMPTERGVVKVDIDGNRAAAYVSENQQDLEVLFYVNDRTPGPSGYAYVDWRPFGRLNVGEINRLPSEEVSGVTSAFFPSDMSISNGKISFGWRGLAHANGGDPVMLVGGLVVEDIVGTYDPTLDADGRFLSDLSSGWVDLDEQNGLFPDNVIETGAPGAGQGSFSQYWKGLSWAFPFAPSYMEPEWVIDVPEQDAYRICMKYENPNDEAALITYEIGESQGYLSMELQPTEGELWWQCGDLNLPVGRYALGLKSSAPRIYFDYSFIYKR